MPQKLKGEKLLKWYLEKQKADIQIDQIKNKEKQIQELEKLTEKILDERINIYFEVKVNYILKDSDVLKKAKAKQWEYTGKWRLSAFRSMDLPILRK